MDDHHIPRTKPNWIIKFLGFFSFASLVGIFLYLVCFSFNHHHCFFPLMVTSTLIQVYLSSHLSILLHFCFHDLNFYELKTCLQWRKGMESEISFSEKKQEEDHNIGKWHFTFVLFSRKSSSFRNNNNNTPEDF